MGDGERVRGLRIGRVMAMWVVCCRGRQCEVRCEPQKLSARQRVMAEVRQLENPRAPRTSVTNMDEAIVLTILFCSLVRCVESRIKKCAAEYFVFQPRVSGSKYILHRIMWSGVQNCSSYQSLLLCAHIGFLIGPYLRSLKIYLEIWSVWWSVYPVFLGDEVNWPTTNRQR